MGLRREAMPCARSNALRVMQLLPRITAKRYRTGTMTLPR